MHINIQKRLRNDDNDKNLSVWNRFDCSVFIDDDVDDGGYLPFIRVVANYFIDTKHVEHATNVFNQTNEWTNE